MLEADDDVRARQEFKQNFARETGLDENIVEGCMSLMEKVFFPLAHTIEKKVENVEKKVENLKVFNLSFNGVPTEAIPMKR